NDDRVGNDQSVYGCRPHGGRSVDEDHIEVGQDRFQLPAQKDLTVDLLRFQKVVGLDVDGVGQEFQLGTDLDEVAADLRRLVNQETMCRGVELVQVDAQAGAEIPLLVEVDSKCPVPRCGKADGEVEGDRGLSAAALCVSESKNMRHRSKALLEGW